MLLPPRMSATTRPSRVPAIVLLVCLPLPLNMAVGYLALGARHVADVPLVTLIGFASAIGYLVMWFPALLLFEPFAVIASIWYTRRYTERSDEPLERVLACWAAVMVHTAVLVTYSRVVQR